MRAVLWDMDGTLVDTEPIWQVSERALVERFGGEWGPDKADSLLGKPLPYSAARLIEAGVDLSVEETIDVLMVDVLDRLRTDPPWCAGARELLLELHAAQIHLALVTMSYQVLIDALLSSLPSGLFSTVIAGDRVTHGKPHPEPYLTGLRDLQVSAAEALAIEDSPTGLGSARAAGIPCLGIPHIATIAAEPGLVVRDSLAGLTLTGLRELWEQASDPPAGPM